MHEPFFTLSLDIKVSDAPITTRCDRHPRFVQDPKITNLDEALARFCEQSAISDYVDNKNRPNVSSLRITGVERCEETFCLDSYE